jgi:hypothetical protein
MIKGAIIDETGKYRYQLWRIWDESKPVVVFIMLNPSTTDAEADDPTIRRCIGFAKTWGHGGIRVVNLFAYRATDPKELTKVMDPTGPDNHLHIISAINHNTGIIIAAWGTNGNQKHSKIIELLRFSHEVHCLGKTKEGYPKHPLYIKADVKPELFFKKEAD